MGGLIGAYLSSAHSSLIKKGITSWDSEEKFTVSHEKIGFIRIIIALLILGAAVALIAFGNSK